MMQNLHLLLVTLRKFKLPLKALVITLILKLNLVSFQGQAASHIATVSVGYQTGNLTYGTTGSVVYTITLTTRSSGNGSSQLAINWTAPSGVTSSISDSGITGTNYPYTVDTNQTSPFNVTLTITSSIPVYFRNCFNQFARYP